MKTTPLYAIQEQLGAKFAEKHSGWKIATEFADPLSEHRAVRHAVGIADVSYRGRHRVTGEDRATFLHRIISNTVEGLSAGQGAYALILTHRGKIIAELNISVLADSIAIDTAPETRESLFNALDKYIVADDVELVDVTEETGAIAVHGPESAGLLQATLGLLDLSGLPARGNVVRTPDSRFEHDLFCVRTDNTGEIGWTLYTDAEALRALWELLIATGADFSAAPVGWTALEALRIEAGVPRFGTELTDSVIPLEAELEHAIDFEKGCYIGQEIVARMKYRGHPNRLLRGIVLDADPESPECPGLSFGTPIFKAEREIGWVTSATFAPSLQRFVALGYVRMVATEAGSRVHVETSDGRVEGSVTCLPFPFNEPAD